MAEIALFDDENLVVEEKWEAHRQLAETLHSKINQLLQSVNKDWHDIEGIVCYKGPGSFTGLRIGLSVANALASSLPAAITSGTGEDWIIDGIDTLLNDEDDHVALPEYGAPVHITQQRK